MGKIKGWKRIRENKTGIAWKNEYKDIIVGVFMNIPNMDRGWFVSVDKKSRNGGISVNRLTPRFVGVKQDQTNKQEALEIAYNYMKAHPNG